MINSRLSRQEIASHYDELARSRKFPDNTLLHQTILELTASELDEAAPLDVLDAGSGAGFFGVNFAALGHRVTLLDPSLEALSLARERSHERKCGDRVTVVAGDVECIPLQAGLFDVVVCIFVFSHLSDPDRAVGELRRVVRKGGRLLVSFESKLWHAVAAGLCERYEEARSLVSAKNPIIKAYDVLPPVRLYSIREIEELFSHGLRISGFTGLRHLTSFQEPLKGMGTTDTEYLLREDPEAQELENMLMESGELLCLARHLLVRCEREK